MPYYNSSSPKRNKYSSNSDLLATSTSCIGIPSSHYDPYRIPPSFRRAKKHGLATRVHKPEIDANVELCECCGLPSKNDPISFWFKNEDLEHLGICFPVYFDFLRSCMILLFIMCIGNYIIIGGHFHALNDTNYTFLQKMNALPFMLDYPNHKMIVIGSTILNFFFVLIFFIYFQYIRNKLTNFISKYDADMITPGDYTVIITGLRGMMYTKDELIEFLSSSIDIKADDIKKIVISYDLEPINALLTRRKNLFFEKRKLSHQIQFTGEDYCKSQKIHELNIDILQTGLKILHIMSEYQTYDIHQGAGTVFFSFNTKKMAKKIKKKFKASRFKRTFIRFANFISNGQLYKDLLFKGRYLIIKRAPEPSDILWENMGYTGVSLWFRRQQANFISCIFMIGGFLLIFYINYIKYSFIATKGINTNYTSRSSNGSLGQFTSIISSLVIGLLNAIVDIAIRKMTLAEKPKSYTYLVTKTAEKLIIAKFFNTAFVTFLTQAYLFVMSTNKNSNIDGFGVLKQLVSNMFYVFIVSTLAGPIINLIDPKYFSILLKRKKLEILGKKCNLTQEEANAIFENPPFDLAVKFSNVIKIVYVCAFYAAYIPIGIPISLIGIIFTYYTDKYILVNRQSIPNELGKSLPQAMIESLEWFAFFYASGILFYGVVIKVLYQDDIILYIGISATLICLFLVVVSTNSLYKKLRGQKPKPEQETYEQVNLQFGSDYDRVNPITKKFNEEIYLNKRLALEDNLNRREEILHSLNNLLYMSSEDIVRYYQSKPRFEFNYKFKEPTTPLKKIN